jgi:hypothetical protein
VQTLVSASHVCELRAQRLQLPGAANAGLAALPRAALGQATQSPEETVTLVRRREESALEQLLLDQGT